MVDQPPQSVGDETLASPRFPYLEFDSQPSRPATHFFRDGIEFPCVELGDRNVEGYLEGEGHGQGGQAIAAFVLRDLTSVLRSNQIRHLGLAEPRFFSASAQIVVEFWQRHREGRGPSRPLLR
jgi:hypothetical protein